MGPRRRSPVRRAARGERRLTPVAPLLALTLALTLALAGCFHGSLGDDAGASATTGLVTSGSGSSDSTTSGESSDATTGETSGDTAATTSSSTTIDSSTGDTTTGDTTTGDTTTGDTTTGADEGECPRVRVVVPQGEVLNVRPDPSTAKPAVGTLPKGAIVDVIALVAGEVLDGNGEWYEISGEGVAGFVWSGLVECTLDQPPELGPPSGFYLPLVCGTTTKVTQGNFGNFSHQGTSAYAFDFSLGIGTPLVAIADGEVIFVYDKTKPGDPCYNGGDASCIDKANVVTLLHGDDTTSIYAHLSAVEVSLGEFVPRGVAVGLSGSSGYSTGRHAHVARQENCGGGYCQSIAVAFEDVPGDGVPATGDSVTSMNCP